MKKKTAVMLCGILLFTMLPAGCGNAGAQARDQGEAEQVSDAKTQDESEEQEKLSDGEDDKSDAGKDAVTDKDTGDLGASKDDTENSQGGKADTEATDNTGGSKSGGVADGSSSNGTGGKNSSSGTSGSGSNSGNAGSGNTSSNTGNTSGGTSTSQPEHTHSWVEQTTTVTHEAVGHYETVVVKDAWDEEVKEERVVCGCGGVFTTTAEWGQHQVDTDCWYGYTLKLVVIDTIHHDVETQEVWVEDSPARTETVGTGSYICSTCSTTK